MNELLRLPTGSGAYRWFYADLHSGDFTAVMIFMVGAVFSPRYSASLHKGALPSAHCAVNFAFYEKGVRQYWVLSEYDGARIEGSTLCIGKSQLELLPDGGIKARIVDRLVPWGQHIEVSFSLDARSPIGPELALVDGQPHWWQPIAPLSYGSVSLPARKLTLSGTGYHDTNHGLEPLGRALRGWRWTRVHQRDETLIDYAPFGSASSIQVTASSSRQVIHRIERAPVNLATTGWGLKVPRRLKAGQCEVPSVPALLESSPFYARLEAGNALGEVADFERFHRPSIRWMAHFRTRSGDTRWWRVNS